MGNARILLVDDDSELLKAATHLLERSGYAVVCEPNAEAAIEHICQSRATLDLVVTDLHMPGMDGLKFMTALKHAFPATPVIVMTADASCTQCQEILAKGAADCLRKPLDPAEFLGTVRRALSDADLWQNPLLGHPKKSSPPETIEPTS